MVTALLLTAIAVPRGRTGDRTVAITFDDLPATSAGAVANDVASLEDLTQIVERCPEIRHSGCGFRQRGKAFREQRGPRRCRPAPPRAPRRRRLLWPVTFTGANWAALNGDIELLRLFIARGANLEIQNDYGGTALSAALCGAVNRGHQQHYAAIVETLIAAGAKVEPGSTDWWVKQEPQVPEVHARILELLRAHEKETSV
jgi:hypothetical protein